MSSIYLCSTRLGLCRGGTVESAPSASALVSCHCTTSARAASSASGSPAGTRASCSHPAAARAGAVTAAPRLAGLSACGCFHATRPTARAAWRCTHKLFKHGVPMHESLLSRHGWGQTSIFGVGGQTAMCWFNMFLLASPH